MRTLKFLLLPIFGALAAILAFRLAVPYEGTLDHVGMAAEDPQALFTYGTKWGEVNRIAFGALICGPFSVILTLGRRTWWRIVFAGIFGAALGGLVNYGTDSSADIIGIAISTQRAGAGEIIAMLAWCLMVPIGIAFSITVAIGVTRQRIVRGWYAARNAMIASFIVQIAGGMLAGAGADPEAGHVLRTQLPVWRMVEIAVGVVLGITVLMADEYVRAGTIRLIFGRNEYRDWSLDHIVNRIGSAEGCEIPVRGFHGVEPVHAAVVRHQDSFYLEGMGPTMLNGQLVAQSPLNPGDIITVGDARLEFSSRSVAAHYLVPEQVVQPGPIMPPGGVLTDAFGKEVHLPIGRYGVGRDADNSICLANDSSVSRHHAEVLVSDTGLDVVDLGSTNGTKINGIKVSAQTHLRPGDVVEFGSVRFTYLR